MTSIPISREIYTLNLNGQNFTLYLNSYWGLILRTENSINTEVLHSQIWHTDEDKHLGLTGTGWHLTRFREEAVEDLNGLSDMDMQILSTEFGLPICTSFHEIPYWNTESFLASRSAIKVRDWINRHPIISKRLLSRGEKIKELFKLMSVPTPNGEQH
ncbi:hypothetical protein HNW13_017475 [Shewanella sp. BF02_Schw]|uniref:hypothetical protein n=1 Tax=Shewanella sp. BF02_Schw TaxID=394908 RepID=UPI00178245EB|nr:hypothetical protein [Shewanella sp. BF02_Schw]MBO1897530.1 hypothetical protein [Shewanella sp. BF02_Schw]